MAKKAKLPKTVAGVKVPRAVRSSSLPDELLNSELGREILAEALAAAAGAVASVLIKKRPSADQIAQAGHAVAGTMTDMARTVLPASLTRADDNKARSRAHRRTRRDPGEDEDADIQGDVRRAVGQRLLVHSRRMPPPISSAVAR
ncbi:hypothetical protein [Microvirga makkahensis]|uniref:Uncharacterized protein n=1 Tax=Microvirga makkahensis TaxID=1128670 RepID=A0A7X3SRW8_9HYPH|nr:hypothetical protein [Microvirga makkahensis]MXQ14810.1 hypothetical protein [Microvirga makkahensis]